MQNQDREPRVRRLRTIKITGDFRAIAAANRDSICQQPGIDWKVHCAGIARCCNEQECGEKARVPHLRSPRNPSR